MNNPTAIRQQPPRQLTLARRVRAALAGWLGRSVSLDDSDGMAAILARRGGPGGVEVSAHSVLTLSTVWACTRLIAETIATLPLSMYERVPSGRRVASGHRLHLIIHDQPNADTTAAVFWEACVAAMLLRGNAHCEKLVVGGTVVGLRFLVPGRLQRFRHGDGWAWRYHERDGRHRVIADARIWHVPGFTTDGENGLSVVEYGTIVFGNALAAGRASSAAFSNGLLQPLYYKIDQWLKPDQRAEFKKNVAGSVERGEAPLLEGGINVQSVGLKPSDAQLLESRAFSVEEICRWFRVPPWMVGHTEKSTSWGTGIEQQMIGFLTFTLAPWLRRIEQAISKDLLTPAERLRYYPKFAVEGLLRADSAGRAAFYGAMVNNGIMTRDEIRALEDRPPMGGNAAVLTVQSAMTTLDGIGQSTDAAAARAALRAFIGVETKD